MDTATFSVAGGSGTLTWSVANARYGSLAATSGRSNVYLRNPGQTNVVNTISVRDSSGDRAQAVINQ